MQNSQIDWIISDKYISYLKAVNNMENYVNGMINKKNNERIWLLEHPSLYTAGTSANLHELIQRNRFPVYQTTRGGKYTYHGPGQRVIYIMLNLKKYKKDIHNFIRNIEYWIINTLNYFNIKGVLRKNRIGVWVVCNNKKNQKIDKKIAAIGLRIRKWVTFHGISLNINPDLDHFKGIIPCGINNHGITSIHELNCKVSKKKVDQILRKEFEKIFGKTKLVNNF